jgi:hypothetical protein
MCLIQGSYNDARVTPAMIDAKFFEECRMIRRRAEMSAADKSLRTSLPLRRRLILSSRYASVTVLAVHD